MNNFTSTTNLPLKKQLSHLFGQGARASKSPSCVTGRCQVTVGLRPEDPLVLKGPPIAYKIRLTVVIAG